MKKSIVLLLALALVGTSMAAPVELKGSLGTKIEYKPDLELLGVTSLQLGFESQLDKNANAVWGFRLQADERRSINNWYQEELATRPDFYAYVESTGALWEGAQPVKMTMGSVKINYSPYIAWFGYDTKCYASRYRKSGGWYYRNFNGVTFDQIKLGTIDTRVFYIFDSNGFYKNGITGVPAAANTMGVNLKGALDGYRPGCHLCEDGRACGL